MVKYWLCHCAGTYLVPLLAELKEMSHRALKTLPGTKQVLIRRQLSLWFVLLLSSLLSCPITSLVRACMFKTFLPSQAHSWSFLTPWLSTAVLFFFKHLYWSIIALQSCVSICFITKWICYTYTICSHFSSLLHLPPSHPPHPTPLGGHNAPSWSPCAMRLLPTSYLFHIW